MASTFIHSLRLFLFAGALFNVVSGNPVPVAQNEQIQHGASSSLRRDGGYFSVLGVRGLVDETHPRLEIRELEKREDQWNLFLLGMWRFQNMNQKDKLSYYQIAGIHGRPHIPWDNSQKGPGNSGGGYCAHSANLFPTWHRPYLALFEEVLYLNARQIVGELQDGDIKDRYRAALPSLRLPYWDFAAVPPSGQGVFPSSLQKQRIDVRLPNGTNTIDNPLYSYRFKPLDTNELSESPFTNWPTTVRDPSSQDGNAASRNDLVARDCDGARPNLQSRVYDVLALRKNYEDISNDREPGDSFESLHNTVHANVGSGGHMSYLAYAAFDPLFWFHHCNVDRLFAIWQALNPDSYVQPRQSSYSTYSNPSGTTFDQNSALTPFHRDGNGNYWNSDSVRYPSTFGYTYPELVGLNSGETAPLVRKVNELYGPNARSSKKRNILGLHKVLGAPNFSGRRQYVANIQARKFALNGSFNCYIFLSSELPILDVTLWTNDDYFVGMAGVLSQPGNPYGDKAGDETNGAVPLTAALEEKVAIGELRSMGEEDVMEYLRWHLKWKIARPTGEQVPVEDTPGFKVSVLWTEVEPAASAEEFPQIKGDYRILVGATNGIPGGFGLGDILL